MANTDSVKVRVLSLNCWGIRYLSKQCPQRYAMIGDMLCKEEHDIVLLQEVWSEKDYLSLKKKLACSHPHSHYFKSGVIGSGLAIFSIHRIHDTFLFRYSLNGYPYMPDCKRLLTHLHAEYCRDKDSYLPHRVVQAWELQQFIRHTSAGADMVILGGDLNMHPQDLGNRLLRSYTGLQDAYLETAKFDGCEDGMTLIADNPFINKKELCPFEKGIRIDYILFKGSTKTDIYCDYIDRQPKIKDSAAGKLAALVDIVTEARTEVKVGLHCAERMRYTATRTGVMGLALLVLELAIAAVPWLALGKEQPFPRTSFYLLAALCFAILLTTFLLYIFYTMELKALQGAEDQMRLAVGSLQEKLRGFPLAQPHNAPRRPPEGNEPSALAPEE
ncbi:Sphingomyelin phosphodiesterase 2 [Dissostichus eleginoides]|uniref:sphingomyelin phosphodiesterase n=1 Tax=Dissostichus eleginoides TaxID=100907 RepID=A0AAD9FHD5_DISEL|nr:Sphingomyelin phosphodiesterase 2 [Dissostichus eleginoides]